VGGITTTEVVGTVLGNSVITMITSVVDLIGYTVTVDGTYSGLTTTNVVVGNKNVGGN
jgi:hypothetical protein